MKKTLSIMLVFLLLISSIYTGVWAESKQSAGDNLMKDYTYKDWSKTTGRPTINAPTDSYSGDTSTAFSVTKLMWRSVYTAVELKAGETYELSFYYKEDAPNKVWLRNDRGVMMAPQSALSTTGDEVALLNDDFSKNLLNGLDYRISSDKAGWYFVNAEITPSVSGNHLLYFTGAAASDGSGNGNLDLIHFSDFSLVKKGGDTVDVVKNVLNDEAMAALEWKALWGTSARNPKEAVLDKSQSYSGNSYAMTFGRTSRYRDNYATVTLKPNTTYTFSFRYKAGQDEYIDYIGFVDASKVDLSTIKGDYIKNHLIDANAPILGKDNAVIGKEQNGVWNLVSTTFTTGTATEYIMYMFVNEKPADQSFTTITFSDFGLVGKEETEKAPNVLDDDVMKGLSWKSLWSSSGSLRDPKMAELDKTASYSKEAYAMTWGGTSRYRDNFTTVTLKANTTYDFSFYYKSGSVEERVVGMGFVDASKLDFTTVKGDYVTNHFTDSAKPVLGKDATIGEKYDGSWNEVKTTFTTTEATEYVLYIQVTFTASLGSFGALTLSDFNLTAQKTDDDNPENPDNPEKPQADNLLNDTVMAGLNWYALWGSKTNNPVGTVLDKSQSYSGNAYAMTFGRYARYRDNYTILTLEPNTSYDFSFRYKSGQDEYIESVGFVDASKVDLTTIKGDYIKNHLTDANTPILGKDDAVIGKEPNGVWNLASTSFTTGNATQYILYMFVEEKPADQSFTTITLSDFNLVKKESSQEPSNQNLLNDDVMSSLAWNSIWGSGLRNPVTGVLDKSQSYSGSAYVMTWGGTSRFRDTFATVTLQPNTTYDFSLYYLSGQHNERVRSLGFVAASDVDVSTYKGDRISNHVSADAEFLGTGATIENKKDGSWDKASTSFTTGEATQYVMFLEIAYDDNYAGGVAQNTFTSITLSDFSLVVSENQGGGDEEDTDLDNLLLNTKPSHWTSSWGTVSGTASNGGVFIKAAFRSVYTKITLEPNVVYHFNADFEHVKVSDIRVYDAAEITDPAVQLYSDPEGGEVQGGKNNLASNNITTNCDQPAEGETYSMFEEFSTSSATEYYIIIDCKMGDGTSNWLLLKNLSLKKFFDPTTDVYGIVNADVGGKTNQKGKGAYKKGEAITIIATPNEGNTFEGWFDKDNNKVSSEATYTFTVTTEFNLTAKFSGGNIPYVDWMEENGLDGTFEKGGMLGWYGIDAGTGEPATWALYTVNDYASHSGKKGLAINARYQFNYFDFDNLAKNTDYYLSFYIYCPDDTPYNPKEEVGKRGFKVNKMTLDVGDDTYWSKTDLFTEGDKGWHKVEFFFNTGDATVATLCINYYADIAGLDTCVHIDDVNFVQYVADELDNGDFANGKLDWMGEFANENGTAVLQSGKKLYQSVDVEQHSLYTVSFKVKGELTAAASKINKYSVNPIDLITSQSTLKTNGDWNEYSFEVYTGMNSAINLVFEALTDGAMVDDVVITANEDSTGAIVEKIDFETDRFAIKNHNTNKEVYEIYEGTEYSRSGNKSLHFKYDSADKKTEYLFQESYIGFQISTKRVYKLVFYYKTEKGNTLKIAPDFLGTQAGKVGVTHTAAGNGWNRVEFFASSSSAIYFDPIIANIVGKTKSDFYIDDITYSVISAAVLDSNPTKLYSEPPVAILYNEGFEEAITDQNWGELPSTMKVVKGDTQFGNKYLNVKGKNFYVLPVTVEAGVQYYFTASVRGNGGYIGLSTTKDGKGLFAGVTGEIESFIEPASKKWSRDGFKFSAPMSGKIYLVIASDNGNMDIDNVLIYKEQYALESIPNGHNVTEPYDYTATSGKNYIVNGGYNADGSIADESPSTGDTFPAVTVILITLLAAAVMLLSVRKNKKEAE